MMIGTALKALIEEPTPEQKRYMRRMILPAIVFVHITWACGWLPSIGIPLQGFVFAADLDRRVKEAVKRTDEKIDAVAKEQAATTALAKNIEAMLLENLMEGTRAKIREQVAKRCKTEGRIEREEINREIDRLQKRYRTYSGGEKYDEPTCAEI